MALARVDLEGHDAGIAGLKQPPAIAVTLRLDQLEAATSGYCRTLFTTAFITGMRSGEFTRAQVGRRAIHIQRRTGPNLCAPLAVARQPSIPCVTVARARSSLRARRSPRFNIDSGHASPAITLKVYGHWFQGTETGIADRLAQMIASLETGKKWAISGQKIRRLMAVRRENP
jgi:hypothetical protein